MQIRLHTGDQAKTFAMKKQSQTSSAQVADRMKSYTPPSRTEAWTFGNRPGPFTPGTRHSYNYNFGRLSSFSQDAGPTMGARAERRVAEQQMRMDAAGGSRVNTDEVVARYCQKNGLENPLLKAQNPTQMGAPQQTAAAGGAAAPSGGGGLLGQVSQLISSGVVQDVAGMISGNGGEAKSDIGKLIQGVGGLFGSKSASGTASAPSVKSSEAKGVVDGMNNAKTSTELDAQIKTAEGKQATMAQQAREDIETNTKALEGKNNDKQEAEGVASNLNGQINGLNQVIEQKTGTISSLNGTIGQKRSELSKMDKTIDDGNGGQKPNPEYTRLEQECINLERQRDDLQREVDGLTEKRSGLQQDLNSVKSEIEGIDRDIQGLNSAITDAKTRQSDAESMNTIISQQKTRLGELQRQEASNPPQQTSTGGAES